MSPDPRARRGVRHQIKTILALAGLRVLSGTRPFAAIAEGLLDASPQVLAALGMADSAPGETTVGRTATYNLMEGSGILAGEGPPFLGVRSARFSGEGSVHRSNRP